jgi:hypothetical protein
MKDKGTAVRKEFGEKRHNEIGFLDRIKKSLHNPCCRFVGQNKKSQKHQDPDICPTKSNLFYVDAFVVESV